MARVSISEAARLANISRPHLYNKYIKPGAISIIIEQDGKKVIDTSDLIRIFGELSLNRPNSKEPVSHLQHLTDENTPVNKLLEVELNAMKELLKAKEEVIEASKREVQSTKDHANFLQEHIKELTHSLNLIEDKREPVPTPKPSGFWNWLKGS